jgi:colanic acid/amylovoran biosynthesis glycosyltransferase
MEAPKKIYLVKKLAPWMMEELICFSKHSKFEIIFFRKVGKFYKKDLKTLQKNGIKYYIEPFNAKVKLRELIIVIQTLFLNPALFVGKYNLAWTLEAASWFLKLDKKILENADCTHAQFASQAAITAWFLKKAYGIKYHFTFHAHDIYFKNRWFKSLVNNSESAFSISEFNIKYVQKTFKPKKDKVKLSRLGVRLPDDVNKKNYNKVILGFMSNLEAKKGIPYLMDAFKNLNDNHPGNFELWIAGNGDDMDFITNFVSENKLSEEVKILGRIRDEKKIEFYSDIDLFVLPSITVPHDMDGIPVVLMESISYGKPIISTDVSGIPEICIDNYDGKLIREKNVEEIVKAVEELSLDEKLRADLANNALDFAGKEYDLEKNSERKLQMMKWI